VAPSKPGSIRPKHPLWIRWTHWINFPLLALMVFSGTEIYWANDIYTAAFIPDAVYHALRLNNRLADGMALHFAAAWILVVNGAAYVLYLALSGAWRELAPKPAHVGDALAVMLHDLGLRKALPPQGKFNAAQRFAYSGVLLMAALAVLSGLAIYKPVQLGWLRAALGGYEAARLIHFLMAVGIVGFFAVHVAQVIRAGWNAFRAMVTGFEVQPGTATDSADARRRSRRAFLVAGAGAALGTLGLAWVFTRAEEGELPWPLRLAHRGNERVWRGYYRGGRLGETPPVPPPGTPFRVNGDIGIEDALDAEDLSAWTLKVATPGAGRETKLTLAHLRALPQTETAELFKCIEGWSQPLAYRGVRFADFLAATGAGTRDGKPWTPDLPPDALFAYVGLETPDGGYYVSLDMESALHPKTLLATEINGVPLSDEHGAPLRLVVPVKYGIKSLKRIGRIFFSDERPRDYWAEQGYDWYAGL
jgi:thiosulfate reductase cytochrome b subunit/DMSO/TMAO reductase YedYZ molybdopterin-dependent catalytic subunit